MIARPGEILATRRPHGSHLEGHWEFPGGKLEAGESPEECLARELREELGVEAEIGSILEVVYHRYPDKTVLLLFYACRLVSGEPSALESEELRWVRLAEIQELGWAPADVPFVKKLSRGAFSEVLARK